MDKNKLLTEVYNKEMSRIRKLSKDEFESEIADWFQSEANPNESYSRDRMEYEYITDYMSYREQESEYDLKELLKR